MKAPEKMRLKWIKEQNPHIINNIAAHLISNLPLVRLCGFYILFSKQRLSRPMICCPVL